MYNDLNVLNYACSCLPGVLCRNLIIGSSLDSVGTFLLCVWSSKDCTKKCVRSYNFMSKPNQRWLLIVMSTLKMLNRFLSRPIAMGLVHMMGRKTTSVQTLLYSFTNE